MTRPPRDIPAAARRAFSLVEVLLAAFVVAIGVLGLTALFAGAARQQQVSSELSRGLSGAISARAVLAPRLGGELTADPGEGGAALDDLQPGVWNRLISDPDRDHLLVPPDPDLYYLATPEVRTRLLYEYEPDVFGTTEVIDLRPADSAIADVSLIDDLGLRRVIGQSVVIDVELTWFAANGDFSGGVVPCDNEPRTQVLTYTWDGAGDGFDPTVTLTESGAPDRIVLTDLGDIRTDRSDPPASVNEILITAVDDAVELLREGGDTFYEVLPDGSQGGFEVFTVNAGNGQFALASTPALTARGSYSVNRQTGDVLLFPRSSQPGGASLYRETSLGDGTLATTDVDGLGSAGWLREARVPTKFISRITLTDVRWRRIELLSLGERLTYKADERRDSGRVPSRGYAVAYRRSPTPGGLPQFAVVTYAVRTTAGRGEFVPDERQNSDDAPLASVEVELGYDDEEERYFVVNRRADGAFATEPGQLLLFAGDPDAGVPGADEPVRVTGRVGARGYLDRAPRSAGASLLRLADQAGVNRLDALAIRPVVVSAEDGTAWGLAPIDVSVFEVEP